MLILENVCVFPLSAKLVDFRMLVLGKCAFPIAQQNWLFVE